ncbi:prefoldin, alpha subunit, variant [Exophiala mesophila]|uniref:Prefoldin, alpha subunit, variant n=1 Tax=Exophiala mesophila TaxID=212818 RepID=A0A0D1WW86_EXOME|nr:prefoldin, alpha subunit, variant [Exophiala mesophila]KIV93630.1 prefoldin, alpha subunit, variant [Exophiala mesophila]
MSSPQNGIDINSLPTQQLAALQQRLSQELEHLSSSFQRLRAAQSRFRDCIRSIQDGVQGKSGETPLLIPLTTSLYVPGTLANPSQSSSSSSGKAKATVLVDVGTGFYVTKTTDDAITFYTGKVAELAKNLANIEKVVAGKNENLRVVEDVMRQKMLAEQQQSSAGARAGQAQAAAG